MTSLQAANGLARQTVYRSPVFAHLLFGLRMQPYGRISCWEIPSLILMRRLKDELRDGMQVLDVGTGPYAVLALWALSWWKVRVVATDVDPELVEHALQTARANRMSLDIRCCDLAAGAGDGYDLIWGVLPYLPRRLFRPEFDGARKCSAADRSLLELRSVGGEFGWEIIDRFYSQVATRLKPGGRVLLPFNRQQLDGKFIATLPVRYGLELVDVDRFRLAPYEMHMSRRPVEQVA